MKLAEEYNKRNDLTEREQELVASLQKAMQLIHTLKHRLPKPGKK